MNDRNYYGTENRQPLYKCLSCENSKCENPKECTNAVQCYKSHVRKKNERDSFSRGCVAANEQSKLVCGGRLVRTKGPWGKYNISCCAGDYCNAGPFPLLLSEDETDASFLTRMLFPKSRQLQSNAMLASIALAFLMLIFFTFRSLKLRMEREMRRRSQRLDRDLERAVQSDVLLRATAAGDSTLRECFDHTFTSGSGGGLPLLVQRTIARNVNLLECIGKGRFGEVWHGILYGGSVAVKIFYSRDEVSWRRETEMYKSFLMCHSSILGFVAADMISRNSCTQLWLITDYHKLGSLYDYLNRSSLTCKQTYEICLSIVNGILHLHTEIISQKYKPQIAHRDLKSKNILMRSPNSCVIADFGLAVRKERYTGVVDIPPNPRVGTKRYMSPEILDESINMKSIHAFKQADIYAFGLVFWELCRRTYSDGVIEEYKPPFFDIVPNDPSFEEMKKVVCVNQVRPSFSVRCFSDKFLSRITSLIAECWYQNPTSRLTALRIQKSLRKIAEHSLFSTNANDNSQTESILNNIPHDVENGNIQERATTTESKDASLKISSDLGATALNKETDGFKTLEKPNIAV